MIRATLDGLKHSNGHPLARELHFSIVLFGLRVLKYSTALSSIAQWRLKNQIVSAALSWFSFAPRWSFGGNRLQIKAETRLLSDVAVALKNVEHIDAHNVLTLKSFQPKEELLQALLENEQARLKVWLNPVKDVKDPRVTNVQTQEPVEATLLRLVKTAWDVNVSVAIHMTMRYRSVGLHREVRDLILNHPHRVINEPEALQIMLGGSLPADVTFQLKYLLYWAPVNPITAVTYFLPAYGNHPFIVQYAMRALESHVVEVTFFYVPQIVQSLRYDALGYVERYIIETAKFSQLFAHQIIWNMKANAFKDEDSQIVSAT
jgi:phosphatidylinositol 4-kinase